MNLLLERPDTTDNVFNIRFISVTDTDIFFIFLDDLKSISYPHKFGDKWRVVGRQIATSKADTIIFNTETGDIEFSHNDSVDLVHQLDGIRSALFDIFNEYVSRK